MITDPVFYAVAIPAVALLGLSKGGFAGVGAISMPLMALIISPVQAAAILLPILILQDLVGVWAFRSVWDRRIILILLPAATVGIGLGYLLAAQVSATVVLGVLGALSILFALHRFWVERRGVITAPGASNPAVGAAFGVVSGFTSQIAHAGGPPFQMWVLPQGLSPASLAGTTAVFFAAVNWIKVPAYWALGQFTHPNLFTAAALAPVAIVSTLAGVWLVRRVPAEPFYRLVYALMILTGVQLVWRALTS